MGQLGAGNGTGYPGALDTAGTEVDSPSASKTRVRAAIANDIYAAVVAIETELGIDPAGSATNLVTRLAVSLTNAGYLKDIADTNGNNLLQLATIASAVNNFQLSNAATGSNPILEATGSDTNVGIDVLLKGTGAMNFQDSTVQRPEIKDYSEALTTANTGTTYTIDLTNGNVFDLTLTGNCTFTFSNPPASGSNGSFFVYLSQDATGGRTTTWPASVKWAGGTAPTLTTTASARDDLCFTTNDGGTTWDGVLVGANFS